MSRRLFIALGIGFILALTGCSAIRLEQGAEKQIRSVAVVALVSEEIPFNKFGLTVFNNEYGQINMAGDISAAIQAVVSKRLASRQIKWQIKPVSYDRAQIMADIKAKSSFFDSGSEGTVRGVSALAQRSGADALIVFFEGQTDHASRGVGVQLSTPSLSSIKFARITTTLFLVMLDPQGRVLAESTLDPGFRMDNIQSPSEYGFRYTMQDNYRPELMGRLKQDILKSVSIAADRMMEQVGL